MSSQMDATILRGEGPYRAEDILLDSVSEKDLLALSRWKADAELARFILSVPQLLAESEIREWYLTNSRDPNQRFFGIYLNETQEILGLARLMFIDWANGTAELGIWIGDREHRGKGYGRQALHLLLQCGFDQLNLHRVFLRVAAENYPAIRLYESVGFQLEGRLRQHIRHGDTFEDILLMGILKHEFTPAS